MHLKHLIAYTGWRSIIPLWSTTKTIQNMHAVRFTSFTTYLSKRWPCWPGSWSPSPRRSVSWSGSSGRTCRWWPLARSLPPSRGHKCTWNIHWWVKVLLWKRLYILLVRLHSEGIEPNVRWRDPHICELKSWYWYKAPLSLLRKWEYWSWGGKKETVEQN